MIGSVEPASGSTAGGDTVYVRFRNTSPFPPGLAADDFNILLEITCTFKNVTSSGQYEPASNTYPWASVRCSTPPARNPGVVPVSVSLNGQEHTPIPGRYTYVNSTGAQLALNQLDAIDPEAFTSWIDQQTYTLEGGTDFYNAFYGAAEISKSAAVFLSRIRGSLLHTLSL